MIQFSSAVLELNRLLGVRFIPEHPSTKTPLGRSISNILFDNKNRNLELQKVLFLIQNLQDLEKCGPDLLRKFAKNLRKAGATDSFYGARFEIGIAASFVKKGIVFEKDESPDLRIKKSDVSIECTSVRSKTAKANKDLTYKIGASVFKKSNLGYATRSMALFIDITNLAHLTQPFNPDEFRKAAIKCQDKNPFGALIQFISMWNSELERFEVNYLRNDHPKITKELLNFLNNYYSRGDHRVVNFNVPYEG